MAPVDAAQADGVDVTFDIYPYPTGSSYPLSYLPGWAQEGGPDAILARLADAGDRARIVDYLDHEHDKRGGNALAGIVFSYAPGDPSLEGVPLPEIAARNGQTLGAALCDILARAGPERRLLPGHCRRARVDGARSRATRSGSSPGRTRWPAPTSRRSAACATRARSAPIHGSSAGTARAFGGISLETMIQRMTDAPARRFGLTRRGRLEPGYRADVTVFDAERIIDTATYDDPRQEPAGIPYVIVNGRLAVDGERCTGVLAGEAVP